jgi:hypothetical protein
MNMAERLQKIGTFKDYAHNLCSRLMRSGLANAVTARLDLIEIAPN